MSILQFYERLGQKSTEMKVQGRKDEMLTRWIEKEKSNTESQKKPTHFIVYVPASLFTNPKKGDDVIFKLVKEKSIL